MVVAFRDALEVGPLDFDEGASSRRTFWAEVGEDAWDEEPAKWERVRNASRVTVWRGDHVGEYLLLLRVAAALLGRPTRLFEIPWTHPAHLQRRGSQPSLLGAPPSTVASHLHRERPVDTPALAARWHQLAGATDKWFRRLSDGAIEELGRDGYDAEVLARCSSTWTPTHRVVAELATANPIGDRVVGWRIRALVGFGTLEGRGRGPYGPAEVRDVNRRAHDVGAAEP